VDLLLRKEFKKNVGSVVGPYRQNVSKPHQPKLNQVQPTKKEEFTQSTQHKNSTKNNHPPAALPNEEGMEDLIFLFFFFFCIIEDTASPPAQRSSKRSKKRQSLRRCPITPCRAPAAPAGIPMTNFPCGATPAAGRWRQYAHVL